jgi:hypothetical protein
MQPILWVPSRTSTSNVLTHSARLYMSLPCPSRTFLTSISFQDYIATTSHLSAQVARCPQQWMPNAAEGKEKNTRLVTKGTWGPNCRLDHWSGKSWARTKYQLIWTGLSLQYLETALQSIRQLKMREIGSDKFRRLVYPNLPLPAIRRVKLCAALSADLTPRRVVHCSLSTKSCRHCHVHVHQRFELRITPVFGARHNVPQSRLSLNSTSPISRFS